MKALGQMAGGIAHEINNPLAIIHSEADELQDIAEDDETVTKKDAIQISNNIRTTTARIAKIIKGLQIFARDGQKDPFSQIAMSTLLDDVQGLASEKMKAKGINFSVELSNNNIHIFGQETQLVQVLVNLLNNAADAISEFNNKWIKLIIHDENEFIFIEVIDSGPGIPPELRSKILQPFFTTKEVGKGTGLGLSISKGIIESHDGEFYIDENCKNTKFVIKLPKKSESNAA